MLLHRVLSYALQHSLATCTAMHSSTCGAKVLLLAQKESNSILLLIIQHFSIAEREYYCYGIGLPTSPANAYSMGTDYTKIT